jgi:putative DNA primase/helicase
MTRPAILDRLRGVQPAGNGWLAFCPAHADQQKRSLSVGVRADGRTLVKCHRGCTADQITRAVTMTLADLAPAGDNGHRPRARRVMATYDYRDARNALLYQVVRLAPKDFRCRRPDGQGGGWIWDLKGVPIIPYWLPELPKHPRVFVCEGEKDCDRLAGLGLAATCNHGGAGKWRPEHTAALRAAAVAEVVVIPDNDDPGRSHAQAVVTSCAAAGLAVKQLELAGLPPKGDAADWLDAGHTREELQALAEAAPPFVAPGPEAVITCLGDVEPEPVEWQWVNRIARGKLALLVGEVGTGKTTVTLDATARMTTGADWPDGGSAREGPVLLLTSEDGLADTVRPIVDRQGGNPRRVHVLKAVRGDNHEWPFTLERDLPVLDAAIQQMRALAVIISPLSAYLGSKDSYKDAEIRGLLTPLAALADQRQVAMVGVMHLTKAQQARLLNRVQGSVAFVGQARTVLVVGEDGNAPGRRLLASVKNNLGPLAPALAFRISDSGLIWEPTPVEGPADVLLAGDEMESRSARREREQAARFLRELLADGFVPSKQVMADAKANGIAQRTLWRAEADLGVLAERSKGDTKSPWYWWLPQPEPGA